MIKRSFALVGLLLLIVLSLPGQKAAAASGISVSPAIQEVLMQADQVEAKVSFKITNNTTSAATLRLSTLDFGSLNESGGIAFLGRTAQETTTYGLKQWVLLEKDTLSLEPGAEQEVQVTIPNKESLAPGGHYGAVVVTSEQVDANNSQSVQVLPSTSVLLLLKKVGGEQYELKLNKTSFSHSVLNLPSSVTLRMQNAGNVHLVPRGMVQLFDPFGKQVSKGIINSDSGFILPQSFRQFNVALQDTKNAWLPGRYKVEVTWRHDATAELQKSVYYVWYTGMLVLIVLIILLLAFIAFIITKIRRKIRAKNARV